MRFLLLAGASALAISTPAFAQQGEDVTATQPSESPIDSLEPADAARARRQRPLRRRAMRFSIASMPWKRG
ncbi:hypothetical protein H9L15_01975 [Sphingomonas daechungensis]|uniref:Uncharacterized protein n=1 Tax=Sphingomonas daechungensis TaxID=1176646 RepID=A0ABX6T1D8_9SPHN|nr:hypothetical protein [Sphingomonas daechungensis]QNP43555.1 hypothetical protein H9L15_01975 [Sphingomonas daechungensis]